MKHIGDKLKLWFDHRGLIRGDSLNFIKLVSIELMDGKVRRQVVHSDNPVVTYGQDWVRSQGCISTPAARFDMMTKVDGYDVSMDFNVTFEKDFKAWILKIYSYIKANKAVVDDGRQKTEYSLSGPGSKWTYPYVEKGETSENIITFTNPNGSLILLSKEPNVYVGERIAVRGGVKEYIMDWTNKGAHGGKEYIIKKGEEYSCKWNLRYVPTHELKEIGK